MTNAQLGKLHQYRQRIDRLSGGECDRAWFDLVLRNVGDVRSQADGSVSSKQLTNAMFERVMAFVEDAIAELDPAVGNYWRDRDARQGNYLTSRQKWVISQLFAELVKAGCSYTLDALMGNVSHGRVDALDQLCPVEANNLIELLKAVLARQHARTP